MSLELRVRYSYFSLLLCTLTVLESSLKCEFWGLGFKENTEVNCPFRRVINAMVITSS